MDIRENGVFFLTDWWNRMHLTISGPYDLEELPVIHELRGLTVDQFGASTLPDLRNVFPRLETLSLMGGRLVASGRDQDPLLLDESRTLATAARLPSSLKRLVLSCDADRPVMENLLTHGQRLTELSLRMHCISDRLQIDRCRSLRVLKLFAGKEFIGEVLTKIRSIPNLEIFHFGGCLNLTSTHLNSLTPLKRLKELFISNSVLGRRACHEIARIQSLRVLKFHSCLGIRFLPLDGMEGLKTLVVFNCTLWGKNV